MFIIKFCVSLNMVNVGLLDLFLIVYFSIFLANSSLKSEIGNASSSLFSRGICVVLKFWFLNIS